MHVILSSAEWEGRNVYVVFIMNFLGAKNRKPVLVVAKYKSLFMTTNKFNGNRRSRESLIIEV